MPARHASPRATLRRFNRSTAEYQTGLTVVMFKPVVAALCRRVLIGAAVATERGDYSAEDLRGCYLADIPSHARYSAHPRTTRLCKKPSGHAWRRRRDEDRRGAEGRCGAAQGGNGIAEAPGGPKPRQQRGRRQTRQR